MKKILILIIVLGSLRLFVDFYIYKLDTISVLFGILSIVIAQIIQESLKDKKP